MLPPHLGIAVDLVPRGPQTVDTVPINIAFPGEELIDRKAIELAYFLDRNPPPAHRLDNSRFPPHRPSLPERRQFRYLVEHINPIRFIHPGIILGQAEIE